MTTERVFIGTAPSAHLRLSDEAVASLHVAITCIDNQFIVRDLRTREGTLLGNRRIGCAYARHGDEIELGRSRLRIASATESSREAYSLYEQFGNLIGRSPAAKQLFAMLDAAASSESTILLTGETGVGKEGCAEAVHAKSARSAGPLVVVDCAALNPGVLESELFGHVRGAFTGADQTRKGAFVEANGGTVFLDEIGELPLAAQPKFLRVLESRQVRPVGSTKAISFDARVIAATNRDLRKEVERGRFRSDLFHRLNVVSIKVPSLLERLEDIPILATRFWRRATNDPLADCPESLLQSLVSRRWHGNVRELANYVEEAATLQYFNQPYAPPAIDGSGGTLVSFRAARRQAQRAFELMFLTSLLNRTHWNVAEAARLVAMDRVYLSKLIRRIGLQRPPRNN